MSSLLTLSTTERLPEIITDISLLSTISYTFPVLITTSSLTTEIGTLSIVFETIGSVEFIKNNQAMQANSMEKIFRPILCLHL